MDKDRRDFLKKTSLLGLTGLAGSLLGKSKLDALGSIAENLPGDAAKFMLPPLPYAYDALEPFIDKQTMEIHHGKHHQAYIDKLNGAAPGQVSITDDDVTKCSKVDETTAALIRNNLGGYYNHSLFWTLLKPNPEKKANQPLGKLRDSIVAKFTSVEAFQKEFAEKALKVFGSGWCWLILDKEGNLQISTTPNQDNPLMQVAALRGKPVLGLDVWEHAYYLKYQNKRADYIDNWWHVVNWEKAEELFSAK